VPEPSLAASVAAGVSLSSAPFWFWWLAPVAATVLVLAVVWLSRRERTPKDGTDAIDDYARFREAMAQVRRQGQERR
jgi:membrane protein implicated in regulation of membrane protease activity